MVNKVHIIYPDKSKAHVDIDDVIEELYFKLGMINKSKYNEKEFDEIRRELSMNDKFMPLYDLYSKNFYIINAENVYNRIVNYHYRLPDEKVLELIKKTIDGLKEEEMTDYKEKLIKNYQFMKNFDLGVLKKNYYKMFYTSQPQTREITSCRKPSFIPFITKKPYYTKTELIHMALNMNLDLEPDLEKLCKKVSENDIDSGIILSHQMYIKDKVKKYVQFYTLLGSSYWNYYIRNGDSVRDLYVEKQIENLHSVIKGAPKLDKQYWVYRFISNDSYLSHLQVGDTYDEHSFISASRNPFYDLKTNVFGFILLKILLPVGMKGAALSIESYSLFQDEEEILMGPSRFKVMDKNDKFKYHHPNPFLAKKIKKMYVMELVEKLELKDTTHYTGVGGDSDPPTVSWLQDESKGDEFASKVYYFYNTRLTELNNKRYFYAYIGGTKYLFHAFYLDDNPVYSKYFFLQQDVGKNHEEMYFLLHDEVSGEILLQIELRDVISVNYIHRYTGLSGLPFSVDELVMFLAGMGKYFNIPQVIIHDEYKSYDEIAQGLLGDNSGRFDDFNPDNHVVSLHSGDFKYYNVDIMNFIENEKRRFDGIVGISYNIKQHHFKTLKVTPASELFDGVEKTPLYNVLRKRNKIKEQMVLEFYVYIHYNYFYMIKQLNELIARKLESPWMNSYALLQVDEYLYNKGLIPSMGMFKANIYQSYLKKLSDEHKNRDFSKFRDGLV